MEELKSIYQAAIDCLNQNPFIHFGVLIILSFIVAKIIDIIFISLLLRLTKKTKTQIDDAIIETLHHPIYYSLLFLGFSFSISVDNLNLSENIIFIIIGLLKTLIILFWSRALFKTFILLFDWYSSKTDNNVKQKLLPLFDNIGKIVIFLGAIYFIMISWGINPVGWLASAGVLGVVLGLAAKDTLANLFSGIFIMMDSLLTRKVIILI